MDKKIFIIEDDVNILYGLQAKFSVKGMKAIIWQGGTIEELLNRVRLEKPDYIVLDLVMPKLNGQAVLKALKHDPESRAVPVFIFTDLSDEDQKQAAIDAGAEQFFVREKFAIDDFVEKTVKIISNKERLKK